MYPKTKIAMMNQRGITGLVAHNSLRETKTKNRGKQSHVVSILISQGLLGYIDVAQNYYQLLRLIQMLWLK